jgi:RHS repeat-associated protein
VLTDGNLRYVWDNGLVYAIGGTGYVQVSHADGPGSVRALTDGTGSLLTTSQADEFGKSVFSQGSSTQGFGYAGEQQDADTGFVYLRARSYAPALGRFLSRDTAFGSAGSPLSLNHYTYVEGNPVSLSDPSGRCLACSAAGLLPYEERFLDAIGRLLGAEATAMAAAVSKALGDSYPQRWIQEMTDALADNPSERSEPQWVVRGGMCTADRFAGGSGVSCDPSTGQLSNVSVKTSPGVPWEVLASYVPNKQVGVTTLDRVIEARGWIEPRPQYPDDPYEAYLHGLTAAQLEALFTTKRTNPNPQVR